MGMAMRISSAERRTQQASAEQFKQLQPAHSGHWILEGRLQSLPALPVNGNERVSA